MSFDRFCTSSILGKLGSCNERIDQRNISHPPTTANILHSMTLGLEKLYLEISISRRWTNQSTMKAPLHPTHASRTGIVVRPIALYERHDGHGDSLHTRPHITQFDERNYFTDENGFLQCANNANFSPLVMKRYKVVSAMGQGSFSQVYRVEDQFLQRRKGLVLKLIRRGCEVLGRREKIFLEHLDEECRKGVNCFVRCLGWLQFADHMGLLLPLYSHTLLHYIYDPEQTTSLESHLDSNQVPLVQPKARSGLSGAIQSSSNSIEYRQKFIPSPMIQPVTLSNHVPKDQLLRTLSSKDIASLRKIALSLLSALYILHKEGVIHGDIKPENIFIEMEDDDKGSIEEDEEVSKDDDHSNEQLPIIGSFGKQLRYLPRNNSIKLGDFGNSIHVSEVKDYFNEFEIQSLPYRAPEVLIGLPFGFPIDIWSLGIMFIELCINKPLFIPKSRQEAVRGIEQRIGKLDRVRFSGGIFSHILFENPNSFASISPSKQTSLNKADHVKSIKRLIAKSVSFGAPNFEIAEVIDFLGQMVVVDPNHRSSAKDLLQHSFITSLLPVPYSMLSFIGTGSGSDVSKKRKLQGTPFHSLVKHNDVLRNIKSFVSTNESKETSNDTLFRR